VPPVALVLALLAAPAADCVTDPNVLGCPLPDGDGDGVADLFDRCPAAPETVQGHQDDDGCPDHPPPRVDRHPWTVDTRIRFARDSAGLRGPARRLVAALAGRLRDADATLMLLGSAHACEADAADTRHALALHRAEAVRDQLVRAHGLDPGRLVTGVALPDQPCDPRASAVERREHTRVTVAVAPPEP
jgi:OmpA-OmpF porin, OOP family